MTVGSIVMALSLLVAAPALAFDCTNASSRTDAGAQLIFGPEDEILYMSNGVQHRLEQGLIDFETGDGFHGRIAFDFTDDGVADANTWIGVGPEGEIPPQAQQAGPACRGVTNIGVWFAECLGG